MSIVWTFALTILHKTPTNVSINRKNYFLAEESLSCYIYLLVWVFDKEKLQNIGVCSMISFYHMTAINIVLQLLWYVSSISAVSSDVPTLFSRLYDKQKISHRFLVNLGKKLWWYCFERLIVSCFLTWLLV